METKACQLYMCVGLKSDLQTAQKLWGTFLRNRLFLSSQVSMAFSCHWCLCESRPLLYVAAAAGVVGGILWYFSPSGLMGIGEAATQTPPPPPPDPH